MTKKMTDALKTKGFRTWSGVFESMWKARNAWGYDIACVCVPKGAEIKPEIRPQNVEILRLPYGMSEFSEYQILVGYAPDCATNDGRKTKELTKERFYLTIDEAIEREQEYKPYR